MGNSDVLFETLVAPVTMEDLVETIDAWDSDWIDLGGEG